MRKAMLSGASRRWEISVLATWGTRMGHTAWLLFTQLIRRDCYGFDLFLSNGLGFRLFVYKASYLQAKEAAVSCGVLRTGVSYSVTRDTMK